MRLLRATRGLIGGYASAAVVDLHVIEWVRAGFRRAGGDRGKGSGMSRRLWGLVVCLALGVLVTASAGAARPVVINKTKADNREIGYASAGCSVAVAPAPGPIYGPVPYPIQEPCHPGIYISELLGFQVVAPRPVPVYISGEMAARGQYEEIDAKLLIFVDGVRVARKPLHLAKGGRVVHLPITAATKLSKGAHRVELSIRPVEEQGLLGMTRQSLKLSVSTEKPESP